MIHMNEENVNRQNTCLDSKLYVNCVIGGSMLLQQN